MHPWLNPWHQSPADQVPADAQWVIPRWEDQPADPRPVRLRWWYQVLARLRWPVTAWRLRRRTGWRKWAP